MSWKGDGDITVNYGDTIYIYPLSLPFFSQCTYINFSEANYAKLPRAEGISSGNNKLKKSGTIFLVSSKS
jgi:hypothetical protein